MKLLHSIRDVAGLPRYWKHSATARASMQPTVRRYAYGPHPRQYFLLLEPAGAKPEDALPWAFYLHGGAWTFGTPEAFRPAARPWLAASFRVVLPSYRRPPQVQLPQIVADCRSALTATATFARHTGRPLTTPQIGGISAGGHLAALLALHPQWWRQAGWPAPPDRALICAAPLDLSLLSPRVLFGRYAAFNPSENLSEAHRLSWLLLHGTDDGMVAYRHSTNFLGSLHSGGAPAALHTIHKGGHLDAGRWTYDDTDPYAATVAAFIGSRGPVPRVPR